MIDDPVPPPNTPDSHVDPIIEYNSQSIYKFSDPSTDWVPNDSKLELSQSSMYHDTNLGHVSPTTYFGHNFSPLSEFTDDSDSDNAFEVINNIPRIVESTAPRPTPVSLVSNISIDRSTISHLHSFRRRSESALYNSQGYSMRPIKGSTDRKLKRSSFRLAPAQLSDNVSVNSDSMSNGNTTNEPNTPISFDSQCSNIGRGYKGKPRGRKSLNDVATKILTEWILDHQQDPYPTQPEKEQLARRGGISVKQVVDWMTNMRKRRLHPVITGRRAPKSELDYLFLSRSMKHHVSNESDDCIDDYIDEDTK